MSRLDQLDSIPERVVNVATAHVGHLVVEADVVTGRCEGPAQTVEILHQQRGVGLAGRPEVVFDPQVEYHLVVGEPTAAPGCEHRGLRPLLEPQEPLVEITSFGLPAPGHRQLDVIDANEPVPHDPPPTRSPFQAQRLLGGCEQKAANLQLHMGSLIKKRRKRMRKKKHKKMLKATRWQRRAAGK
jgi:hypothetical protein